MTISRRYTFLREKIKQPMLKDRLPGKDEDWSWAKKLVNDLNKRDAEIQNQLNALQPAPAVEAPEEETEEPTAEIELVSVLTVLVTDPAGNSLAVANGLAYFPIDAQLEGKLLGSVEGHLSSASDAGDVQVMLRRVRIDQSDQDMLARAITIQEGKKSSNLSELGLEPDVDGSVAIGVLNDQIWIDVRQAGANAKGLTVVARYVEQS